MEVSFRNNLDLVLRVGAQTLKSERFLAITPHGQVESGTIVGVNADSMTCPADGDVELLAVHQFGRAVGVYVYDDAIDGGALA